MKKGLVLVFLMVFVAWGKVLAAETWQEAFQKGKASGEIKFWYQTNDRDPNDLFEKENTIFDTGLRISYKTDTWRGFQAKASFYAVDDLWAYDRFANLSIHRSNPHETMTWLGEAYLLYTWRNTQIKVGRQNFKNPLVNSDAWAVFPNNFQGYLVKNTDLPKTTLLAGWFTDERRLKKEDFSDFLGDDGVYFFGLTTKAFSPATISAYYYRADLDGETYSWQGKPYRGYVDAAYLEAKGQINRFSLAVQYFFYNPDKGGYDTTKAFGVKVGAKVIDKVSISLAFTTISDGYFNAAKLSDNGIKTPLYTATISGDGDISGRPNTDSFKVSVAFKPLKDLSATLSYGNYNCANKWNTAVSDDNVATSTELVFKYTGLKNFTFFLALINSDHHGVGAWRGAGDDDLNSIRAWVRFTF